MNAEPSSPRSLPEYARHLWGFGFMNAVCFTIALGSPMVLCARYLNARESLIGFLLALTPLFTALQLPAARFADRWGYRNLMMAGWRARAFMVLLMVPLPLLVKVLPASLLLFLLTALLVAFNAIRGFASGSWNPWIKQLIAPSQLGRYFSIESIVANIAGLLTLLLCGFILGHNPAGWHYALLLAISGTAGVVSVMPLRRCPPGETPNVDGPQESLRAVARRVWANKEYRRLVRFAMVNSVALGAVGGFNVLFLREIVGFSEGRVVLLTTAGFVGSMAGAFMLSRYLDYTGSRPVMRIAGFGHIAFFGFLTVFAAVGPTANLTLLIPVILLGGVIGNASGVATGRLILNTCPREDLTVAMALSQVGQALSAGIATVAWGFMLEWLRAPEWFTHTSRWPFFIYFAWVLLLVAASQFLLNHVREASSIPTNRFIKTLLIEWPQRAWEDLRGR